MRVICICLISLLFLSACNLEKDRKIRPVINKGVLDLRGWNFEKDGVIELRGEWEFYWNQLLAPQDFSVRPENASSPSYFNLPELWTNRDLPAHGFATFRLRVIMENPDQLMSLKIQDVYAAHSIYARGVKIGNSGLVASDRTSSKDQIIPLVADVPAKIEGNQFDILLQISNYSMYDSGLPQVILLGSKRQIHRIREAGLATDLFLIGSILIMALYHLGLFSQRREDKSTLYFALFSIGTVFYTMLVGESFLFFLFPGMNVIDLFRILLLATFSILVFLSLFMNDVFPDEYSKWVVRGVLSFTGPLMVAVIVTPPEIFIRTHLIGHVLLIITLSYTVYSLLVATYHRQIGALSMLLGFSFWFLMTMNDILYYYRLIDTGNFVPLGLFVFIFSQAYLLSQRFNRSFKLVESMSLQLEETNIELSRIDRIKDEFLSNTSHELKTPLNGIIGLAQSLIDGISGKLSATAIQNLSMIVYSGKRLSNLINDILDFSKLTNNEISLKRVGTDVSEQVDIIFTLLKPILIQKQVELVINIPDGIPLLDADENRLSQILYNLIGNAIKFSNSGTITIKAITRGDQVEICVVDTGIGIPEDQQSVIFNSFQQVDSWTHRNYEGTGLGLSITKNLVELHGGKIWVDSVPGEGSTFTFTIPIYSQSNAPHDTSIEKKADSSQLIRHATGSLSAEQLEFPSEALLDKNILKNFDLADISILAVDDDEVNLQVIQNSLSLAGANVICARSGYECLDKLAQYKPDIILLDVMMPKMNGYKTAEKVREKSSFEELPIIFLTAKNQPIDIVSGFKQGGNDYIVKPFSSDELITRIQFHQHLVISRRNLQKAETKYRQIFERAVEGIFQADSKGTIVAINPAMAAIFGYKSLSEMISLKMNIRDLVSNKEDKQQLFGMLEGSIRSLNFDAWFSQKSGYKFWGSIIIQVITDQSEEQVHLEGIVLDISDRRQREIAEREKEIAEESNKAKSEFLALVTHELRTPLQGILGYSKLGFDRQEKLSSEKLLDYFQSIYKSGQRLLGLVNNLLDLSRLEHRGMDYTFQKESLSIIIQHAVNELMALSHERKIDVIFNKPDFPDRVEVDITKINQLIINVVANAIKFSDVQSKIELSLKKQNDCFILSVADNGIGIPEDELRSVFDKFGRSSKTKGYPSGSGLGLAIAKEIAEAHGGLIWAETNPEGGTIVRTQLPQKQPAAAAAGLAAN